jgi:hypothetical protein
MARSLRALSFLILGLALARSAQAALPTSVTVASPVEGAFVKKTSNVAGSFTGTVLSIKLVIDDDTANGVNAPILNTGYLGTVTFPSEGAHTLTAIAHNADGDLTSDPVTVMVDDTKPVVTVTPDVTETGDRTVTLTATVTDAHFDPNDPNTLIVNGAKIPYNPVTQKFRGKAPLGVGTNDLFITARDTAGNVADAPDPPVSITRTVVCNNPTQETNNNDPLMPHYITVDRLDDRVLPDGFDPNANPSVACDIRPALHPDDPNDPNDPNDPKNVNPPVGRCTLRAALQLANAHPGPDVIQMPGGTVKLTRSGDGDLRGDLDVTDDLLIHGLGRDVSVVDARKIHDRVFDVAAGVSFKIFATTLRGGQTPKKSTESGGCLRIKGPRNSAPEDAQPSLVANNLALVDCKSGADGGGLALETQGPDDFSQVTCGIVARSSAKGDGGGMLVEGGALELRNSTIAFSSAGGVGGALAQAGGSLVMTNATISTNKAKVSGGGLALAGGASAKKIKNVTFARNKAKRGASVSTSADAGELHVSNSILGDKPKATCDLAAPLVSGGGNLDPGDTCGLASSDPLELVNTDPRLDKLSTNFGIPTQALRFDSPAIDHGVFATCEPLDERTADRVDGPPNDQTLNPPEFDEDRCDSGSFEFASQAPPETPAP